MVGSPYLFIFYLLGVARLVNTICFNRDANTNNPPPNKVLIWNLKSKSASGQKLILIRDVSYLEFEVEVGRRARTVSY